MKQIKNGLNILYKQNIIHRDLKPQIFWLPLL